MRDFLDKMGPQDRALVIGDSRQHQGVEAGKPFEQMQDAGMRTTQLDKIVRQRDPELLAAVEKLSRSETAAGITMLQQQGRVTEIPDRETRIAAIAMDFAAKPENTIIVSPDNASRREINRAVRVELQNTGQVSRDNQFLPHPDPPFGAYGRRSPVGGKVPGRRCSALHHRKQGHWPLHEGATPRSHA